jgi:hypothetical protein
MYHNTVKLILVPKPTKPTYCSKSSKISKTGSLLAKRSYQQPKAKAASLSVQSYLKCIAAIESSFL